MNSYPVLIATCETDPDAPHDLLHQTAVKLLTKQITEHFPVTADEVSHAAMTCNPYGKPSFLHLPFSFNLSHTKGLCASIIAAGEPGWEVGIDVETIRPYKEKVAKRVCSDEEMEYICHSDSKDKAFTKLWTLKEAYIKAIGTGLSFPLKEASFSIQRDGQIIFREQGCCFTQQFLSTSKGTFYLSTAAVSPEHLPHI